MKYPSKKGFLWYAMLIIMLCLTVLLLSGVDHATYPWIMYTCIAVFLLIDACLIWIHFDTWYMLHEEYLEIRCACFSHVMIAYQDIQQVIPSRSWLSSCALSIDRVQVTCMIRKQDIGMVDILISPIQKQEFIIELKKKIQAM